MSRPIWTSQRNRPSFIPFDRRRFKHISQALSLAIYDLSLESRASPFLALKQDLRNVVEYGRPNQKPHQEWVNGSAATIMEVRPDTPVADQGLQSPIHWAGVPMGGDNSLHSYGLVEMTPISRLKDKLAKASGVAQRVATQIEGEADDLIAQEGAMKLKTTSAFAPHKAILTEARGELQAIEDALNLMSNGGPELDPLHEPEPIAPVSTTEPQA